MTPQQWAHLTPDQRAQHIAQYGPPPAGYSDSRMASATLPPAAPPILPPAAPLPRPPAAKMTKTWLIGAGVVVLLLIIGFAAAGHGSSRPAASSSATTAVPPTSAAKSTCTANCATVPYLLGLGGKDAAAALDKAGFTGSREQFTSVPAESVVIDQDPMPGASAVKDAPINLSFGAKPVAVPEPMPAAPAPAKAITARQWALIAKSPDQHVGESIVVYGQVEQFDAATGTSTFRASVDGVKHPVKYGYADYETNTVLVGTPEVLGDIVEKDLFRAEVTVTGSLTYDTTLGGSMTVPQLQITKIEVIGTAK